jgi:hypothetical protein
MKESVMSLIFGESSFSRVTGIYDQADEARHVVEDILHDSGMEPDQVKVVVPDDPAESSKREPKQAGIAHTLFKAHITLGITGLISGLLFAGALMLIGVEFARASPYYTVFIAMGFGGVLGMMMGGLVSLRPDHDVLISKVEEATQEGRWAVVVHPRNAAQQARAEAVIIHSHGHMVHTF